VKHLHFENDGPKLIASNYWGSDLDRAGYNYLSGNAGAMRLLLSQGFADVADLTAAKGAALTLGHHARFGREMIELLFDDDSESPYALYMTYPQQCDMLPEPRRVLPLLVYGSGARLLMTLDCRSRRRKLPDLRAWRKD
jgi:hypothetical protein